MKRAIILAALAILLLAPHARAQMLLLGAGSIAPPPGFVLKAHTGTFSSGAPTTSAINTTGANLFVVCASYAAGSPSVTDSTSANTYTSAITLPFLGGGQLGIWYVYAPTTNASQTFTLTGATFATIAVQAWSGSAASPLDSGTNSNDTPVGNTVQPGSITPSQNNELVETCFGDTDGGTSTYSINDSFTISNQAAYNGASNYGGASAYLLQSTAAPINPTWTSTATVTVAGAAIVSFK